MIVVCGREHPGSCGAKYDDDDHSTICPHDDTVYHRKCGHYWRDHLPLPGGPYKGANIACPPTRREREWRVWPAHPTPS